MESYSNDSLILCADFNFNPYVISQWQDRALDKIFHHNSILLMLDGASHKHVKTVTVDGVLLSYILTLRSAALGHAGMGTIEVETVMAWAGFNDNSEVLSLPLSTLRSMALGHVEAGKIGGHSMMARAGINDDGVILLSILTLRSAALGHVGMGRVGGLSVMVFLLS